MLAINRRFSGDIDARPLRLFSFSFSSAISILANDARLFERFDFIKQIRVFTAQLT
jgi:hypothetical protein